MTFRQLLFVAPILAASACISPAETDVLQDTVDFAVSLSQHEDSVDILDAAASLDKKIAAAPADPYVLKVAATARMGLANITDDRAVRFNLRQAAIDQFDLAMAYAKPNAPPRPVMLNGQQLDVDLGDLRKLRDGLSATAHWER